MRIKGVPDIERVTIVKQDEEWVIQTAGSNLAKGTSSLMALIHPGLQPIMFMKYGKP